MLYISIVLIFTGIVILVYSLFYKSERVEGRVAVAPGPPPMRKPVPEPEQFTRRDGAVPVDRLFEDKEQAEVPLDRQFTEELPEIDFEAFPDDEEIPVPEAESDSGIIGVVPAVDDYMESPEPAAVKRSRAYEPAASRDSSLPGVTLFDDRSGKTDYGDPALSLRENGLSFENIKRIGSGVLEIEREGINFYKDNKFFRFDFHRIDSIRKGDRFIAVILRGSPVVKLFLFNSGLPYINRVAEEFNRYQQGRK